MHSGRARGACKRGSEDVLLIEVAPGLFTGFWESPGGSCCYCCWWDLKVLWYEPCRTGEEMLGKQLPPGVLPLVFCILTDHYLPLHSLLSSTVTLWQMGFGDPGSCPTTEDTMISSLFSPTGNHSSKRSLHHGRLFTALVESLQGTWPELKSGMGMETVPEHLKGVYVRPFPRMRFKTCL